MKRYLLTIFALSMSAGSFAQQSDDNIENRNLRVSVVQEKTSGISGIKSCQDVIPASRNGQVTGTTEYDLQSNRSVQNRLRVFPGGTAGSSWILSFEDNQQDKGTGYNYFDGTAWQVPPVSRIETFTSGWPSYAQFGLSGEIVVSHQSNSAADTNALILNKRSSRGTGSWIQSELPAPEDAHGLLWSRMVTNGPDHQNIHIIALTKPTTNNGSIYQGMDGALVYNRSLDGGNTWTGWQILPGMTSAEYPGFDGDAYAQAEPRGDVIAFVVGNSWTDQFLMKSVDNGITWTKTIIWDCPYDFWNGGDTTGIFWCPDGASAVTLDQYGSAHVVFCLQRAFGNETGEKFWYPWTDGVVYWNENDPEFSTLEPDSLKATGNYIGWIQDTTVWLASVTELAFYNHLSMTSLPGIITDDQDNLFVTWSGVCNIHDTYSYFMFRHIYGRASVNLGETWRDTIFDISAALGDSAYESVFASLSPYSDQNIYFLYQMDSLAGCYYINSGQTQYIHSTNYMVFGNFDKERLINPGTGIEGEQVGPGFTVCQNIPNPCNTVTVITVETDLPGNVTVAVFNVLGKQVRDIFSGEVAPGHLHFSIDCSGMEPGIYLYKVTYNNQSITKRMIVR